MRILQRGDTALKQVCNNVNPEDYTHTLIRKMWEAMYREKGIGLAANQLGVLLRVIVVDVRGFKQEIINPIITLSYNKMGDSKEGCLSYPGKIVTVRRHKRIKVEGYDKHWNPIKAKLHDLAAYCVQHEIDHLNGVTIA